MFASMWLILSEISVFVSQVPADLPARISVMSDAIATNRPASEVKQPDASTALEGANGLRELADGRIAISRANIDKCRQAQIAKVAPAGIDCARILSIVDAERRRTAEGTLLRLLGENSEVTRQTPARVANSADANAVARDISNGIASGDVAAIAALQRGGAPPIAPR